MTNNIFGEDFDLDPDFDTKHLSTDTSKEETKIETESLDSLENDLADDISLQKPTIAEQGSSDLFDDIDWSGEDPLTAEQSGKHTVHDAANSSLPELNSLLDEYGIDTESKSSNVDDRITKMHQRVENKQPTERAKATKKAPLATFLWLIGCGVLVGLIIVQYTIFNINTVVKNPEYRENLAKVCDILSCQLPNADLESVQITHIKHRPSQVKTANNNIDIMAAIVNTSKKSQLYPNLKVTIYGTTGKVGEFVASPDDYMKIKQSELFSEQARLVMFTLAIKNTEIRDIEIKQFY